MIEHRRESPHIGYAFFCEEIVDGGSLLSVPTLLPTAGYDAWIVFRWMPALSAICSLPSDIGQ
jgi:hypothetical protein